MSFSTSVAAYHVSVNVTTSHAVSSLYYVLISAHVDSSRKRSVGVRPRTFNFYCECNRQSLCALCTHSDRLVAKSPSCCSCPVFVCCLQPLRFAICDPVLLCAIGCCQESGKISSSMFLIVIDLIQLLHVYAKHYEANGQVLLIRIIRYSLDGKHFYLNSNSQPTIPSRPGACAGNKLWPLPLAFYLSPHNQAVFLAYMVVLKKSVNVGLAAFLIFITALVKL